MSLTLPWSHHDWHWPVRCRRCREQITGGVTHFTDRTDPPTNALCDDCFETIMELEPGERDVRPAR